jgi:UDP-N-acetylmuramoylalanine--D-glutamate ligase
VTASDLAGKRVTVMGLGLLGGGVGVTRFLVQQGAEVTVTDLKGADDLADSVERLADLPVQFHLGGHRDADFTDTDLVVVNPAVPDESEFLVKARDAGVPLTTEINLFFQRCPATIVGVTGSNGKSTTASLLHHLLGGGERRAWLGGNIGCSLLQDLGEMTDDDVVVLELSSFQLERLDATGLSPAVSIVLNVSPNHLDRHGTLTRYRQAKQPILTHQRQGDFALLNGDCPVVSAWAALTRATVRFFSTEKVLDRGAWLDGDRALWRHQGPAQGLFWRTDLKLPGPHFLCDGLAAAGAAVLCGVEPRSIPGRIRTFRGLEHRLEFVREIGGIRYYNDSKATTPEAALAALDAFAAPVVLIAGGSDKGLSWTALGRRIRQRAKAALLIGQTADAIREATGKTDPSLVTTAADLADAVAQAHALAQPGDVVLLSPGTASYDMFANFEERGETFKRRVAELAP